MSAPDRNRSGFFAPRAGAVVLLVLSAACGRSDKGPGATTTIASQLVTINGCALIPELGQSWCGVDVGGATAGSSTYDAGVFRVVGRGRGLDLPSPDQDPNAVDADQMRFV